MAKIIALKESIEGKNYENPDDYRLTEKQIRSFPDFKNISEEELLEIRDSLYQFSLIVYEFISREKINTVQIKAA